MLRHFINTINYEKLFEIQANQPTFCVDRVVSKKVIAKSHTKSKGRVKKSQKNIC